MKRMLRISRRLFNEHTLNTSAVFYSMLVLLLSLYCINVQLPKPYITFKALSVMIIISLIMDFVAIGIKTMEVIKQWKAEGFTFSLKLADDIEDNEEL